MNEGGEGISSPRKTKSTVWKLLFTNPRWVHIREDFGDRVHVLWVLFKSGGGQIPRASDTLSGSEVTFLLEHFVLLLPCNARKIVQGPLPGLPLCQNIAHLEIEVFFKASLLWHVIQEM